MTKTLWLFLFLSTLTWSAISPKDYFTWFLEAGPAIIGLLVIALTARKFPLTPITYLLILVHSIILMVGAHYTYADVPLFDWLSNWMGWERNNYDKLGHFAQGFIPAIICREIVIRNKVFNSKNWQNFFIICFCLGFSALYELIEWWVAEFSGSDAVAFLGTQGYQWDTQSDMMLALTGSIIALASLARFHDHQLANHGKWRCET